MFGLFSNRTKKIEEKLSKLAIEIASIQKILLFILVKTIIKTYI